MIEIEINGIDEIIHTLNLIANKTKNKTNLMRNIADTMESAVLTNFDVGGRPAWLGIKHRQGSPLVDTENLMSSITSDYDNDSALVGTDELYAAIHQFGGMAGRGRKVKIPARPFLQLTSQDEEDILDDVQTYWQRLLG
ncbi:phage virion morphogenesis protein [Actinobacillus genomosp. 2]|uniref:phage virion morphogenesis protein n=1 Tax=Actinobacillus genomosp. 2 TaxID=230709 RepID=UPI002442592C|nr:phage virion morphogenesis protein [Actinobacillus genomosp. 2]WGE32584.1 phage virion morphogenesis protein [Actinobacillus genomosp. 2]